ncbi:MULTISPECIES: hypothetical protein [unclassified Nocardia]|uniref:hypothetical protein n=1 Tax=unclassified Nocardia TaxID=2637762 RepID=UPI0033AA93D7
MDENSPSNELARVMSHPVTTPTGTLAMFLVHPAVPRRTYTQRLRELISAAVEIAQTTDFDQDEVVTLDPLPTWFRETPDVPSIEGSRNYVAAGLGDPWEPEEWIYCFDPDLRAWTWWDVTERSDGVAVWVDTLGEPHVPHGELLWALYITGAEQVDPLRMEAASSWCDATRLR